jgi:hypothetical protein
MQQDDTELSGVLLDLIADYDSAPCVKAARHEVGYEVLYPLSSPFKPCRAISEPRKTRIARIGNGKPILRQGLSLNLLHCFTVNSLRSTH